jgi:uncharacterized glyoxalase superfamily protein PhnB
MRTNDGGDMPEAKIARTRFEHANPILNQGQPGTWVWLGVEDVDALFDEYRQSGATIVQPPENFPWACEMKVADPDGHVLRFGSDPRNEA